MLRSTTHARPRSRTRSRTLRWLVILAAALGVGSRPRATTAGPDGWDWLRDESHLPSEIAAWLPVGVVDLGDASAVDRYGDVRVLTPESGDGGTSAEAIDGALTRARDALGRIGLAPSDVPGRFVVVRLRQPAGAPLVVATADGQVVFVREVTGTSLASPWPVLAPRPDGPPTVADVVEVSDRLLEWLSTAARGLRGVGPGTFGGAVGERALASFDLPEATPSWLRQGLACWATEQAYPGAAKDRFHICGSWQSGGTPASRLLRADVRLDAGAARWVGRALALALEGVTDAPARFAAIAASGDRGEAAWAAAFGQPAGPLLARTLKDALDDRDACDAAAALPCTLCRPTGRIETTCPSCEGLGHSACSSCGGWALCFAPGCRHGGHATSGDEEEVCSFCGGSAFYACEACGDRGSLPCKVCRKSGKRTWTCPACAGSRRLPCPQAGGATSAAPPEPAPCPWCTVKDANGPCPACAGTGIDGCDRCRGATVSPCASCSGVGCATCSFRGKEACDACKGGSRRCGTCSASGTRPTWGEGCALCGGTQRRPGLAEALARLAGRREGARAASETAQEIRDKAVAFLLDCRSFESGRPFALREQRASRDAALGAPRKPTLFSNAQCLWALATVGIGRQDDRVADAWDVLEAQVDAMLEEDPANPPFAGLLFGTTTQEVALALRALVVGGEPPTSPRIQGLIRLLVRAQRPNGLWSDDILFKGEGDEFEALFALESLYLAKRRGASVPSTVWAKALAGGQRAVRKSAGNRRRSNVVYGTDVASSTALVVICLYGTMSEKGARLEDYRKNAAVQKGLAWLDRYFRVEEAPVVVGGALARDDDDGGYFAFLYAVQRLAQLLSLDRFNGRRWYVDGVRHLRALQLTDGSFEELSAHALNGPVRCTTISLLFLARATPAVTEQGPPAPEAGR